MTVDGDISIGRGQHVRFIGAESVEINGNVTFEGSYPTYDEWRMDSIRNTGSYDIVAGYVDGACQYVNPVYPEPPSISQGNLSNDSDVLDQNALYVEAPSDLVSENSDLRFVYPVNKIPLSRMTESEKVEFYGQYYRISSDEVIQKQFNEKRVSVSPNPVSSSVSVDFENFQNDELMVVEIYDSSGSMVYNELLLMNDAGSIDLSGLSSGLYVICFYNGLGWFANEKLLVE